MYDPNSGSSFLAGVPFLIFVAIYLYHAFCQFYIAQKIGHPSAWWAFIPVLNFYQPVQLSGKPWWWFLLLFVPVANIICWVIVWMEIAKKRDKSPVWGVMLLVPVMNLVAMTIMASGPSGQPYADKSYADKKEQERVNVS